MVEFSTKFFSFYHKPKVLEVTLNNFNLQVVKYETML